MSEKEGEPKTVETKFDAIANDIASFGEVHLKVADVDQEIEARRGQTRYNSEIGLLLIDDGTTVYRIDVEHVVYWYTPKEVMHN